jgi:hypothetical protein
MAILIEVVVKVVDEELNRTTQISMLRQKMDEAVQSHLVNISEVLLVILKHV